MGNRGMFIDFEGIDGSGTTTQVPLLKSHIKFLSKYNDTLETHEPWRSDEIKKRLREDEDAYSGAEEMAGLYVDDRINHSAFLINPNLEQGVFVLSDRYALSTFAYQTTQGVSQAKLFELHNDKRLVVPDITFFLRVSSETALARIKSRNESREKFEQPEFLEKLANSYDYWVEQGKTNKKVLLGNIRIIDGEASIEDVAEEIRESFDEFYVARKSFN